MSLRMRIANLAVGWLRGPQQSPADLDRAYRGRAYPSPAAITRSLRRRVEVDEARVLERTVYTLAPKRGRSSWHVIYTHGGSFVNALVKAHWDMIEQLVTATGATVIVPMYPLAPEHAHPTAFELLERVYRDLVARVAAEAIVLCGDSAGGNLALVQALRYRELGLPQPAHVILFSPWVDISAANPEIAAVAPRDRMLRASELAHAGGWWAGDRDVRDPTVSPLFAELHGLPPIHIYQGTEDILLPDARLLRDRIAAAGGRVDYHETPGGFHDFMGATFTPEARAVFAEIGRTLRARGT